MTDDHPAVLLPWPGRWAGSGARTWLHERLRVAAVRHPSEAVLWDMARGALRGHLTSIRDWRRLTNDVQDGVVSVVRGWAERSRGQRAACAIDAADYLASQVVVHAPGDPLAAAEARVRGAVRGLDFIVETQRAQIARHQQQILAMIERGRELHDYLHKPGVLGPPGYVEEALAYLRCPPWPGTEEAQRELTDDIKALLARFGGTP